MLKLNNRFNLHHDYVSYGLLIFATLFWASAFIVSKDVIANFPPLLAAAARFFIAAIVWIIFLIILEPRAFTMQAWKLAFLPACLGMFIYNIAFFIGLDYSLASHSVIIVPGLGPAITAIFSFLILKERITQRQILGISISFIGLLVLLGDGLAIGDDWHKVILGDIILFICPIVWSLYTLRLKFILGKEVSPLAITGLATIIGALGLGLLSLFMVSDIAQTLQKLDGTSWLQLGYLGLFGTNLAFLFWTIAVKQIGSVRSVVFLNLVPFWGIILALIFLSEPISLLTPLSLVLILMGVWFTQKPKLVSIQAKAI